jgi:bifunctional non-homologous end joining protein LigD
VQLYAFDIVAPDGDDLHRLPLSMRKTNLARLLVRRPDSIFVAPFEQGEIDPDLFRAACKAESPAHVSRQNAETETDPNKKPLQQDGCWRG